MKGITHVIGISKKMGADDAVAYLGYHRHMQTIKLQRLKKEVNATEEAIETLEQEIARRKEGKQEKRKNEKNEKR